MHITDDRKTDLCPGGRCVPDIIGGNQMKRIALLLLTAMSLPLFTLAGNHGKAYLGVHLAALDDDTRGKITFDGDGVLIKKVIEDTAAEKAGLVKNDVILRVGEVTVNSPSEVIHALNAHLPGTDVILQVLRDGKNDDVTVTLGERPNRGMKARKWVYMHDKDHPWVGIDMEDLNPQLAEFFGVENGILIKKVVPGSPAEEAGLLAGDVITAWNGESLTSTHELMSALAEQEQNNTVTIGVQREKTRKDLDVTLGARSESNAFGNGLHVEIPDMHIDGRTFHIPGNVWKQEFRDDLREDMQKLKKELKELKRKIHEKAIEKEKKE